MLGEPLHTHSLSLMAAGAAVAALLVAFGSRHAGRQPGGAPRPGVPASDGVGPRPAEALTALREELVAARRRCASQEQLLLMLPECTRQLVNVWLPEAQIPSVAVRQVKSLLEAERAALFLRDPASGTLTLASGFGLPDGPVGGGARRAAALDGRVELAAELKVLVDGATSGPERRRATRDAGPAPRSGLEVAAPILSQDELLGVLAIGGSRQPADYQRWLLTLLAELTAVALMTARSRHEIRREATTDPLTGLFNRKYLMERLPAELRRAEAYGSPLSIVLFDVDHFKHYNDRNGHPAGDACLRTVARIARERMRGSNFVARYGGDEFVTVLVDADLEHGLACAEQIRAAIASARIPGAAAQPGGRVSISAGVAAFPTHGRTLGCLVEAADAALYRAKQAGRNRVTGAAADAPTGAEARPSAGSASLADGCSLDGLAGDPG